MHEHGLRETNSFARESLDTSAQGQMFSFDLLRVEFADGVGRGREVAVIDSCRIGVKVHEPKRLEHLLQLQKDRIGPIPEDIGQDHPSEMINRVPQPPLVGFAPHKTPHLIDLRRSTRRTSTVIASGQHPATTPLFPGERAVAFFLIP
jgi:hypothetical protein